MSIKFKVLCLAACLSLLPLYGAQATSLSTGYDIRLLMGKVRGLSAPANRWDQPNRQPQATQQYQAPAGQPAAGRTATPVYAPKPVRSQPRPQAQPVSAAAPSRAPAPAPMMTPSAKSGALWPGGTEQGARASSRGKPLGGILSEISIGALLHDEGPFSNTKEDGYDAHIELRFASPSFLDIIWSPEPHIGANSNSEGDTSQVFFGLSYEWLL